MNTQTPSSTVIAKSPYQIIQRDKKVGWGVTPSLRSRTVKQTLNICFFEKQLFPLIQVWPIIWNRRNLSSRNKRVQGRTANPQPLHNFLCSQQHFRHMPVSLRKTSGTTFTKYTVLATFCQGLDIYPYNIYNTSNANNSYEQGTNTTVPKNEIRSMSSANQTLLIDPIISISASIIRCHIGIVNSAVDAGRSEVTVNDLDLLIGDEISWYEGDVSSYGDCIRCNGIVITTAHDTIQVKLDGGDTATLHLSELDGSTTLAAQGLASGILRMREKPANLTDTTPYEIYALVDPRNDIVRYVGMSKNAETRFQQHMTCNGQNLCKIAWIRSLRKKGLFPSLQVLETVGGRARTLAHEAYWIGFYAEKQLLTNHILNVEQMLEVEA